jgi:hypothetical protein
LRVPALFGAALLAACGFPAPAAAASAAGSVVAAPEPIVMYLARRSWHIDVGFAARDLRPSLAFTARRFPRAQYLFFGFGDRHYLLSRGKGTSSLAGALFPGAGLILVTALENTPAQAFGAAHVLEFDLSASQADAAQRFMRDSLLGDDAVAEGPYDGSAYYGAVARYSAFHTCNTWAAEALKSAALEVHTHLVLFAGQLWKQARKITTQAVLRTTALERVLGPRYTDLSRRAADCRSGKRPLSSNPAGPLPWSSVGEADSSC